MSSSPSTLRAHFTLAPDGRWVDGGGVTVRAGRIERFCATAAEVRRGGGPVLDLGDVVLLPGFVAAHTHLDLSGFEGRVPPGRSFPSWIRALLGVRGSLPEADLRRATRATAEQLVAGGTTCVGDIDATGRLAAVARGLRLRVRRYREVLDAGDGRRAGAVLGALASGSRRDPLWTEGISPHAPYTVSAELWAALARHVRRRRTAVAIHWAETREERAWLEHGRGPFADLLASSPRRSGLDAIEAAGLLGPRTALIHGNDATTAERERVARSGAAIVHCPGTHAFFEREPFDAEAWRAAGVPLALGTDSLASNADLDMRREMALFRAGHPGFRPAEVLDLATGAAARAVGLAGRVGTLAAGAWADLAAHAAPGKRASERLDAITRGLGAPLAVWVGGRRTESGPNQDSPASRIGKQTRGAQNEDARRTP
ncbi:MAG: amidohydrolase family protein [Planctomycetota bacterium]|nr:amidohydrolase family protein [Planctomycetota bacterium]